MSVRYDTDSAYITRKTKLQQTLSSSTKRGKYSNDRRNESVLPSTLNYNLNKIFPSIVKVCKYEEKSAAPSVYYITQKDICKHGIIIRCPGVYKLASTIKYNPLITNTAGIIVAADDVILDLGVHSLKNRNGRALTYGIVVARDVKNVKIIGEKNVATILNFSLGGIRVFGRTNYITLNGVITRQSTPAQMTNEQIPENCEDILDLQYNLGLSVGEGDTFGYNMIDTYKENTVKNLSIKDCIFDGSTIGLQIIFTFGIELLYSICTRCTYYGCLIGSGWLIPGDDQFGLAFPTASNGVIRNCRFEENKAFNSTLINPGETEAFSFLSAIGIYEVTNFKVTNNLVADNFNDSYIIAADHDRTYNIEWTDSVITNTTSTLAYPVDGLHFSGSVPFTVGDCLGLSVPILQNYNITIKRCTVSNSFNSNAGSLADGIVLAYVVGASVVDCHVSGISGGGQSAGYLVVGGLPGGRSSGITFDNCTAENCQGIPGSGTGRAAGFYLREVSDNLVLNNCVANKNGNTPDLILSAGILIRINDAPVPLPYNPLRIVKNIDINNCITNGNGNGATNSGGIVVLYTGTQTVTNLENVAIQKSSSKFNNGAGILIKSNVPAPILGGSVNECEIYQNTRSGLEIVNNTAPLFASRNVAYANGSSNYIGIPSINIIEGTTSALPHRPGFLNVSISAVA